jgi:hypothetical protein
MDAQTPISSLHAGCAANRDRGESETCPDRLTLVDITVLTFPCDDKLCFKASQLYDSCRNDTQMLMFQFFTGIAFEGQESHLRNEAAHIH